MYLTPSSYKILKRLTLESMAYPPPAAINIPIFPLFLALFIPNELNVIKKQITHDKKNLLRSKPILIHLNIFG